VQQHNGSQTGALGAAEHLDALADRIRAAHAAVQAASANALAHALAAGDALNAAKARMTKGWGDWVRQNCGLGASTARLYRQLAAHRGVIEARRNELGALTVRAARELISTSKTSKGSKIGAATEVPTAMADDIEAATTEVAAGPIAIASEWDDPTWTSVLTAAGLEKFLRVCPGDWRSQLAARAAGPLIDKLKALHPNTRIKNLKRGRFRVAA
jgi:hypothetical protein